MDLLPYIIICPLVFLAGFVDAVAGGGGLISLPAYIIAGIPVHNSIATNKLSSCMGTFSPRENSQKNGLIRGSPHWQESFLLLQDHRWVPISLLFLTPVYS